MTSLPENLVIAVLGLAGAGKSVVATELATLLESEVIYFGGVILQEVCDRRLEITPENERLVREDLRDTLGPDAVARISVPVITKTIRQRGHAIIDGVYTMPELIRLRTDLPVSVCTVAVHAPRWLRKERLGARAQRPLSDAQVDERDLSEVRALGKAEPIVLADLHIVNAGSIERLREDLASAVLELALAEQSRISLGQLDNS